MTGGQPTPDSDPGVLPKYSLVLNPTDGSPASWPASLHAVALAKHAGAALLAVFVVDEKLVGQTGLYLTGGADVLAEEGERATGAVADLARRHGVPATTLVARGRPGEAIVRLATERGADAIVMGAAGKSALERALLGSVSEYVLHRAACLVCVLRATERR